MSANERPAAIRRLILLAALSALLTLACYGLTLVVHPQDSDVPVLPESAESALSQALLTPVNARLSDGVAFTPTRDDAQLYIKEIDREAQCLCLRFESPLPARTRCELFYALDGELRAEASVVSVLPVPVDEVIFRLPMAAQYDFFRVDIDEPYTIRDLLISADAPQTARRTYAEMASAADVSAPWSELLIGFVLFAAAGSMLVFRRKTA